MNKMCIRDSMYTDPVALQARPEPNVVEPTTVDAALAAQNLALIEVRSVYDTDGLQRMAEMCIRDRVGTGSGPAAAVAAAAAVVAAAAALAKHAGIITGLNAGARNTP